MEFIEYPKTPRLFRGMTVSEKIDGTCCALYITEDEVVASGRNKFITPANDSFGFATWAHINAHTLREDLGTGIHRGEWWGSGIQRKYGREKGDKTFSLFNTSKWQYVNFKTPALDVVPVLYEGLFSEAMIRTTLNSLKETGSWAQPGFMHPEGVCVYHEGANMVFKVLVDNDNLPKSKVKDAIAE
jgi:hypothetical protein